MTLAEILDKFPHQSREGDGYVVSCPVHGDAKASLRIGYNETTQKVLIKCRAGCDTADVLEKLDMQLSDLFDVERGSVDIASAEAEAEIAIGDIAALTAYIDKTYLTTEPAVKYAERFGITPERFADLGLGYDDGSVGGGKVKLSKAAYHDAPRLVVPFRNFAGQAHYLQARAIEGETKAKWSGPSNPQGSSWGKYGFFEGGNGWAEVVVTEGPGDALTVAALGYDAVAIRGAGLGTNASLADEIAKGLAGRKVLIAGDADKAGIKFTRDVAKALSDRGLDVYKLTIPHHNDITEWRENTGNAFDRAFIMAVQEAPRFGSDAMQAERIAQDLTRMFSDVFNAKALLDYVRASGADIKYTSATGFIVYFPSEGVWRVDDREWIRRQAQDVAGKIQSDILREMSTMDARVAAIADPELREKVSKHVDGQRFKARNGKLVSYVLSTRGIDAMLRELRALEGVATDYSAFDTHKNLLAVKNGVVNLETGELSPYDDSTKALLLMSRVDYDYKPGAKNPRWLRFLDEIFEGKPEFPAFMQRLIGYGITGQTTEQSFAILWGNTGQNGKSVLVDTVKYIFSGIAKTTSYSTFEQKQAGGASPDIAALKGARLVMAAEGNAGKIMDEAMIKRLTGGDEIVARFLYKDSFGFYPEFLIMLMTNHRPRFRGQDGGLWRRVKLIPFTREFKPGQGRDNFLGAKFRGERVPDKEWLPGDDMGNGPEGILAWAIEGAKEWFQTGLAYPEGVEEATEEYKQGEDILSGFIGEKITFDADGKIWGKDVWTLYNEWADEEGLTQGDRLRRTPFWAALEERGAAKKTTANKTYFRGIRAVRPTETAGQMEDDNPLA